MTAHFLIRGMLTGLIAGILAFGFATIFGEPQIESAIAFEETLPHSHGDSIHKESISRSVQSTIGLLTGVLIYSVSLGGLFSLVFAVVLGRIGPISPRGLSAAIAIIAFFAIFFIPSLKYPANPPSVGLAGTIELRTQLFFLMIFVSIVAAMIAVDITRRITVRIGIWNAAIIGVGSYVLIVGLAGLLFPSINEVPKHFSATLLWDFRIASLGIQIVLWTTLGIVFGWMAERMMNSSKRKINSGKVESRKANGFS